VNMERGTAMLSAHCEAAGLDISSILNTVPNHISGASSPHCHVATLAHSEVSTDDTK
jgi:hypothetical protein